MYDRILVPVDGSRTGTAGLREAIRLATTNERATLRVLHVLEPLPALQVKLAAAKQVLRNIRAFEARVVANAKSLARRRGVRVEGALLKGLRGRTADAIVAEAARWKADIIVIGTHGRRGISRIVLGSDAEAVAGAAPVPVLLVRSGRKSG